MIWRAWNGGCKRWGGRSWGRWWNGCWHNGRYMRARNPSPARTARDDAPRGPVADAAHLGRGRRRHHIRRSYDLCDACRRGQVPLDVRIGLGLGTLSPTLRGTVCRLGIEATFETAMDAARGTLGVTIPDETARRDTEGLGAVAKANQRADMDAAREGGRVRRRRRSTRACWPSRWTGCMSPSALGGTT